MEVLSYMLINLHKVAVYIEFKRLQTYDSDTIIVYTPIASYENLQTT